MGFETLVSLTGMEEVETARLIVTLWALSGLNLAKGEMPSPVKQRKPTQPITPPMIPILPTVSAPSSSNPGVAPPVRQPDPAPKIAVAPPEKPIRLEFDAPAPAVQAPIMDPAIGPDQTESAASEDIQEAISPAQNALKVYKRAKYLLLQDRTSETVRLLEESVKLDPEGAVAYDSWLLLGRLRMANPAWSVRAMDALQAANKLRPKAGEPFALMGELYHRKGFKREAAQNYRKAIELNPLLPIPQEVDMTAMDEAPEEAPKPKPTFWQHVKAWWDPTSQS
jgi:hypothetical protein